MPKADATGLAPEKSAQQNPPAPFLGRRRVLLYARPISRVKSQSGGLGHSNATTARRALQIESFTALPAKLDGKQSENLGGKDRDPLHSVNSAPQRRTEYRSTQSPGRDPGRAALLVNCRTGIR